MHLTMLSSKILVRTLGKFTEIHHVAHNSSTWNYVEEKAKAMRKKQILTKYDVTAL